MTNLQAQVKNKTVTCIEPLDLTVQFIYNNKNISFTTKYTKHTKYVINTTDSLIMSSLQPSATIHFTLRVIDTDTNIIGSTSCGSFVVMSPSLSSMTPIPTSSGKI